MKELELPVPILQHPHWRIVIRPTEYVEERIPTRKRCIEIIDKCKVGLRGWDYPHVSREGPVRGDHWVASWCEWTAHLEYWRYYQSGQFVHLLAVRESVDSRWTEELRKTTASHLGYRNDVDWDIVPGFISTVNTIYTLTEVFEFVSRLCQAGALGGKVEIQVQLSGVKGFVLTTDWNRAWSHYYCAAENTMSKSWTIDASQLVAESQEAAFEAIVWFFESFGWSNPSRDVIVADQQKLLTRTY